MGGLMAVGCASADRPGVQSRFQELNGNNSWPERPGYLARESVLHPFEVQQMNAGILDSVLNTTDFDAGTERLNGVGREKLNRAARKMPMPDQIVFLQTAGDVAYDETMPERSIAARTELDQKRAQAILTYLSTRPNTRGVSFQVQTIDIADPNTNSSGPASAVRGLANQYRSSITGAISNGNPAGTGGGLATNTIGVTPTATAAQGQQQGPPQQGGSITIR
jgi:hypothetical protein